MKKSTIKKILLLLVTSLFVVSSTMFAAAANGGGGGGGNGNGSGGGQEEPLAIESSNIQDGQAGVAVDEKIKITFTKNITFDSVRLGNEKAFSIVDQDGNPVEINIILADSSNRDERNNVVIEAVNGFEEGKTYILTIDASLESKSGATLGKAETIKFTTVEKTVAVQTEAEDTKAATAAPAASDGANQEITNPKTADSITVNIIMLAASIFSLLGLALHSSHKKASNI
jgi:nucleoid-associated protein YgaU